MMLQLPLLQPLAVGHGGGGARPPTGDSAGGGGAGMASASPRPLAAAVAASPSSSSSAAGAAGRAPVRRRGQLVLEGLSAPRVAARARVDAVAVLGAHVALSISVADGSLSTTALLGFAGLTTSPETEEVGSTSHGFGRRRARGERGAGPVASDEEQRRFLADLARGQLSRLPGLLLGEPTQARTLGLHFFLLGPPSTADPVKQWEQPNEAGPEPRLLAMQADGLVQLWALRGRQRPAWVPLTSFLLPFRHRPLPGMMSFDGASRRLVYVEAISAASAAGSKGAVAAGGAPSQEQLRVVSREVVFTPVPGGDQEVVTVGCAVPVAHVADAAGLEAVRAGTCGCWIVTAGRVGYNCFRTKRLVWMARRRPQEKGAASATRRRRAFFALHAITEQLLALDPWEDGGAVSVYTAPGNGTPLTRRVLHRGLLSRGGDAAGPIAPQDVGDFAVHRNLALVSLPGHAQLAVFHLRTGDAWCRCPLPPAPPQEGGAGGEDGSPPRFWVDRSGATALGVWWPERGNALLRLAHPTAAEEQAFLAGRGHGGVAAASRLCGEHGPSLAHALSHRALDAAHAAITTRPSSSPAAAVEAAVAAPSAEGSDEDGDEAEDAERGLGPQAVAAAAPTPLSEVPLVLRAGLLMAAGSDEDEGAAGSSSGHGGVAVRSLAHELRAALRDADELRREASFLAAAPVPRSEEGDRREALAALAKRLRAAGDGRFRRVTPLLLAAEPLLREWLEQQERGGDGQGLLDEAAYADSDAPQQARDAPIASAVDLAYAVCRTADDRGELAAAWTRVLADAGADGTDGAEAPAEGDAVLRPLLLYCCALGDDGFLEALAPLLFRLQPARLVHLVARLAEPDLQPLPFQPPLDAAGDAPRPRLRYDFHYRAPFLALPVPPAILPAASGGPNPFDDEEGEEEEKEEQEGAEAQDSGGVDAGAAAAAAAEGDEGEAQRRVSRAVYARALRLVEPLLADGAGGGEEADAGEREAAYRALLEGAGRFVCLARRLILHSEQRQRAQEDGWTAALGLLDRLRTAACVRAHHQVFAFLLGQALAASDLGRVEAVMARRPPAFGVADVGALARRLRDDGEAVAVGSLKRCLALVLETPGVDSN